MCFFFLFFLCVCVFFFFFFFSFVTDGMIILKLVLNAIVHAIFLARVIENCQGLSLNFECARPKLETCLKSERDHTQKR